MAVNLSLIGGAGWQFFDDNGDPLSGGKIYTYAAGTTTPLTTYTSRTGTIPNTNPIILDAAGRTPQQIWSTEGLLYKYVVKTSADVLIRTWDNIGGSEVASDLAQDLANTTNNAKGDALVGFRQSNASGFLTGSVGRTVNDKLQEFVSVLDFGADPTGVADSSTAIQAAINSIKPINDQFPEKGGTVYFPPGIYRVNTSIKTYSGILLKGAGDGSVVKSGASLTDCVFELSCDGVIGTYYTFGGIDNMRIQTTDDLPTPSSSTVRAIKAKTGVIVANSVFQNINLWTTYGLQLDTYTQACIIYNIYSIAYINQILNLKGNFNRIESIDKEGQTGSSTEPYIYIGGTALFSASGNMMKSILIEGAGSVNKPAIKFQNSTTELQDFWDELTTSNGFSIELDASVLNITGVLTGGPPAKQKYKLRNNSRMYVETFTSSFDNTDWQAFFDYDANSYVMVQTAQTLYGKNVYKVSTSRNLNVYRHVDEYRTKNAVAGRTPISLPSYRSSQNLLINPSFEAGIHSWGLYSSDVPTFPASEVAQGLMFALTTSANFSLEQIVAISSAQIGQPLTLSFVIKVVGAGYVYPIIANYADTLDTITFANEGWQTVTITHRPTTSGNLVFGFSLTNVGGVSTTLYVDEMSLCSGDQGLVNSAKFGSYELNQRTYTALSAAPTTGTWKQGDRVFNSTPSVGQPKGWICTVAGSPGTWVSEGNL